MPIHQVAFNITVPRILAFIRAATALGYIFKILYAYLGSENAYGNGDQLARITEHKIPPPLSCTCLQL